MSDAGPVAASGYSDLVFHVLAHVPAPERGLLAVASCSFEPRYLAWAHKALPHAAFASAKEDAALISRLLGQATEADVARLSCLPFLCPDLPACERVGGRSLAELEPEAAVEVALLHSLRGAESELLEIVWCTALLCREAWAEAHAQRIEPALRTAALAVAPAMAEAARLAPQMRSRALSLSFVLGPRGRGYGGQVLVGAPLPWNGLSADSSAVIALHEHAVSRAGELGAPPAASLTDWHRHAESVAVAALRRRLVGHRFGDVYRSWLGGLDLAPLGPPPKASLVDELLAAL